MTKQRIPTNLMAEEKNQAKSVF